MSRSVLNVDIANFPIAVERVIEPRLRGRPVVVALPGSARAPVLVVSQEAAREGVRAGMALPLALRRCPDATILHPDEALYKRATGAVLSLLGGYSPLVEPATLGQTFLDLTGTVRLFGAAQDVAARIRREIEARLRLKPTVGLGTSKLVSRVAARVIRPDGLCDVFPGSEAPFLAPLPVELLPSARGTTRERLSDLNVGQVADLLRFSEAQLLIAFGAHGGRLRCQALGIDASPVRPPEAAQAVVEEETLAEDSNEEAALLRTLFGLCERAGTAGAGALDRAALPGGRGRAAAAVAVRPGGVRRESLRRGVGRAAGGRRRSDPRAVRRPGDRFRTDVRGEDGMSGGRYDMTRVRGIDLRTPLRLRSAFAFPLQTRESRREVLIGAALLLLPGLGWLLNMGHQIQMVHNMQAGVVPWPSCRGYGRLLKYGMVTFLGMVEYYLPAIGVGFLAGWKDSTALLIAGWQVAGYSFGTVFSQRFDLFDTTPDIRR